MNPVTLQQTEKKKKKKIEKEGDSTSYLGTQGKLVFTILGWPLDLDLVSHQWEFGPTVNEKLKWETKQSLLV